MCEYDDDENNVYVNIDFEKYGCTEEELIDTLNGLIRDGYVKAKIDSETGELMYSLTKKGENLAIFHEMKILGRLN
jgi:DNA-binding HxlR family transcriptional regulator